MYYKGVNLGNWLVLEKWMSPAVFEGTDAQDEYYLPEKLSRERYEERIRIHRSEYITERDFARIRNFGLNLVRIPVPYFVFGDREPFIGCTKELDHAFSWAEYYGLQVLIDLHTAPMSQNGFDNGGICGVCRFSQLPDEIDYELSVLEKLAKRYGQRKGLMGIEVLNEPITREKWDELNLPKAYPPADPELAKGSRPNSIAFLEQFYDRAYKVIRPYLHEEAYVVFHDAFLLHAWKDYFASRNYHRVMLDTHQYIMTADRLGCTPSKEGYLNWISDHYAPDIEAIQAYVPVLVGEWSLYNRAAGDKSMGQDERGDLYRELARAQYAAWSKGSGDCYWNYKLLLDTVETDDWYGWDCWDYAKASDLGWL